METAFEIFGSMCNHDARYYQKDPDLKSNVISHLADIINAYEEESILLPAIKILREHFVNDRESAESV